MSSHRQRHLFCGRVQGVGFRPAICRLATSLSLQGWVQNTSEGVLLEVEGTLEALDLFSQQLPSHLPKPASIHTHHIEIIAPVEDSSFQIRDSREDGHSPLWPPLDMVVCEACLHEFYQPSDRRYQYPLLNCTQCGPRYSILHKLPYDRPQTSMSRFPMCSSCLNEYESPENRRFHAQPTACKSCGPKLNRPLDESLLTALCKGHTIALKGVGGFQLLCDATSETAVQTLRQRKHRPRKPLALLMTDFAMVQKYCEVNHLEKEQLESVGNPIVLLPRKQECSTTLSSLAESVVWDSPELGVMLPTTPLHHWLSLHFGKPLVCTSANLSGEPLYFDESESFESLSNLSDELLTHNRPILHPVDDSVVRVVQNKVLRLRIGRGLAPLVLTSLKTTETTLAVGGQFKGSFALSTSDNTLCSPYVGDLENYATLQRWEHHLNTLQTLTGKQPQSLVCDLHPDYQSTRWAEDFSRRQKHPLHRVQHHHAHLFSVMAEHPLKPPVLGFVWDGTGYGLDGTLWGGEAFLLQEKSLERVASLLPFALPGGDKAVQHPARTAFSLLWQHSALHPEEWSTLKISPTKSGLLKQILERNLQSPTTSSMGRLFDAVAVLSGFEGDISFEGEAAMWLEWQQARQNCQPYSLPLQPTNLTARKPEEQPAFFWDWQPLLLELQQDLQTGASTSLVSSRFHRALVKGVVDCWKKFPTPQVVLSGGCFQNKTLLRSTIQTLQALGVSVYWNQLVPCNDGGLALGQLAALQYPFAIHS